MKIDITRENFDKIDQNAIKKEQLAFFSNFDFRINSGRQDEFQESAMEAGKLRDQLGEIFYFEDN